MPLLVGEFGGLQTRRGEAACSWPFRSAARVSSAERCVDQPPAASPPSSCRYQRGCYDVAGDPGSRQESCGIDRAMSSAWTARGSRKKQREVVGNTGAFSKDSKLSNQNQRLEIDVAFSARAKAVGT